MATIHSIKNFIKQTGMALIALSCLNSSIALSAPTPEQIQLFKSLPKDQQQAILKKQGIQIPNSTPSNAPYQFHDTVKSNLPTSKNSPTNPNSTPPFQPYNKTEDKINPSLKPNTEQTETELTEENKWNKYQDGQKQPNDPFSTEALKRFGADLFSGTPTTFAPTNDIPVPTNYVLGPGDQLNIQLFGNKTDEYSLTIDRNGQLTIPGLKPITLAGLSLDKATQVLKKYIKNLGVGVKSYITLGQLRSYRIFVLGESNHPGSYVVSGLSTISQALYVSGGINAIGSLRNIQLKRNGKRIATLDLYDFLLHGDTQNDKRLLPGDTIFIPPAKTQISIAGEVNRPAIYEIKHEKTLQQALQLAGGVKPTAYLPAAKLSRISQQGYRSVIDVNLKSKYALKRSVKNGDILTIPALQPNDDTSIVLQGEVLRQGKYQWKPQQKLLNILPNREAFTEQADLKYLIIQRQPILRGDYQVIAVNWEEAKQTPSGKQNITLMPRDKIYVLNRFNAKQRAQNLAPLNNLLQKQATLQSPPKVVSIMGKVKFPGQYPLSQKMHVKDLIEASGQLDINAMVNEADLIRFQVINGEKREVERITFNLQKAMAGNPKHNLALQPYDQIIVKQVSQWSDTTRVATIKGEVKFPGTYIIRPGETLEDVLQRAGGFTEWAAPQNAVFLRKALKEQEQREYSALADELQKNLLLSAKQNVGLTSGRQNDTVVTLGNALIEKIKQTPALGRLVISLDPKQTEMYHATLNIKMRDGDELIVPKQSSEVVVMGEVSRSASILYQPDAELTDYLKASGGLSKRADPSQIYIVHGDGSIQRASIGWFSSESVAIRPGDTIVVPMDVERINPLITWTSVSKILSNFAVTAATLKTVGVIN